MSKLGEVRVTSLDITRLRSHQSQTIGKSVPWRLNQELLATVLSSSPRGKLLEIDGKTYNSSSNAVLEPGQSVLVKVVSISPRIELALVGRSRSNTKAKTDPAAILSLQLLQKTQNLHRRSIVNLLLFIKLITLSSLRSLPGETLSLLASLKKKLVRPEELSDINKLKPALQQSGLLLESKLAALDSRRGLSLSIVDADLKAILFQLFKSLNGLQGAPAQIKATVNAPNTNGLSAYKGGEAKSGDIRSQLMQKVEDALSRIILNQNSTLDEHSEGRQRWFFELAVSSPSQTLSIPVTIYHDGAGRNELESDSRWSAEFSIELENSGSIKVYINIVNTSVSVLLHSKRSNTAQFLDRHCDTLQDYLNSCGLTLSAFNSDHVGAREF